MGAVRLRLARGFVFSASKKAHDKTMHKLNKKLSWKLLFPIGVVLTLIGHYGGNNFVLITIGFLGNILMFIGLIGFLAYFGLWITEKLSKKK